ncbi:MAG: FAD-binding oxidoreductase [Anaerolineaceae bacterium]|nr:FAD-binding oxidoreductase [Anaerolineaceae bacterium]
MSMNVLEMTGSVDSLDKATVAAFKGSFRGDLIQPGDGHYEQARQLYNGMIDKRPGVIARCADTADVQAAVNFARENRLLLAVRGGGHNGAGLGSCDGGLVIDLALLKDVQVNETRREVRAAGGCTWSDVDQATYPYGLAVPTGFISTTGVGGLTLGGGLGYLTRHYGLTIDNLLGVDIVLADGRLVTANAQENADLFWAVRGGGGNFGVVTSFLFRGNPVGEHVYGGPIFWPLEHAAKVMRFWRDLILTGPEELNGWFGFHTVPPVEMFPAEHHLQKMAVITWCYTGALEKAEEAFKPIRQIAPAAMDFAGPIPLPALQSMFDGLYPPGLQWYWNADFFTDLSDDVVDRHVQFAGQLPSVHSTMHLYPINGAAHRVGQNDTAWSYRSANFAQVIVGVDPDPANNPRTIAWSKEYWRTMHPYSAGGAYVNMMMDEGQDRVKAAYRENYPRLAQIKAKYDPQNLFRVNQNIKPA